MSVGGAGPRGPQDLDEVGGSWSEQEELKEQTRDHSGIGGIVNSVFNDYAYVSRRKIKELPSIRIEAKDGSQFEVDLFKIEHDVDRKWRPAARFTLGSRGQDLKTAALFAFPGKPTEISASGEPGDEVPLSLRHATVARHTVDKMLPYLSAAAAAGAPLKPGAEPREIATATQMLSGIDTDLKRLESIVARSPEAKLATDVFTMIANITYKTDADLDRAIADLGGALGSIGARTALSADERALVKKELETVRSLTQHWRAAPDRFHRTS